MTAFDATPLTATIGSEVRGIDLVRDLSPTLAAELRALLLERAVLVFRDQKLTPETHLSLGAAWGALAPRNPMYPHVPGHEQIMVVRDDPSSPPENETWHADLSFRTDPPFAALLHGVEIPSAGGDTLWADMRAAADALSAPMRAFLSVLEAEHSQAKGFDFVHSARQNDRAAALANQDRSSNTSRHPVLKAHPSTGSECGW
ncbi:MAG: TauD/TfdA family dioxygenase [Pseudomonadota bacterium]